MFAVINAGGKQYKVEKNNIIRIEKLEGEKGSKISFDASLIANGKTVNFDGDSLKKSAVSGEIIDHIRDDKVIVFKKKRRQNYRRKYGHRQDLTVVKITDIKEGKY